MMRLNRRQLLRGLVSSALLAPAAAAARGEDPYRRLNGRYDPVADLFHWEKIGVDAFGNQPLAVALTLFGISSTSQAVIIPQIEIVPGRYTNPDQGVQTIKEGHVYAAMVSGGVTSPDPWVASNVAPHPDASWSSTLIDVWVVYVGDDRYVIGRPHACNNWIVLATTSQDFQCRCEPSLGDVCSDK